jgi:hypothetical protein
MLRQVIGLSPRCWRPGIEVFMLFLDLWVIGNNVLVAIEALFHGRHSWMFGTAHIRMTELTLDLLHTGMHLVAKGYGLRGAQIRKRCHVEQIQEKEDGQEADSGDEKGCFIP